MTMQHEKTQQAAERVAAKAERKRRKLALNGEGTLTEQHIDRVKRLWSVLRERNHNMYQYRNASCLCRVNEVVRRKRTEYISKSS